MRQLMDKYGEGFRTCHALFEHDLATIGQAIGSACGSTELERNAGIGDVLRQPLKVDGRVSLDPGGVKVGKWIAFGLGLVEDIDGSERDEGFGFGVDADDLTLRFGPLFVDHRSRNHQPTLSLFYIPTQRLPGVEVSRAE